MATWLDLLCDLLVSATGAMQEVSTPSESTKQVMQDAAYVLSYQELVSGIVQNELNVQAGAEAPLLASGMNSRGANQLRTILMETLDLDLPGTFVFDYPSIYSIAGYLAHDPDLHYIELAPRTSMHARGKLHCMYYAGTTFPPPKPDIPWGIPLQQTLVFGKLHHQVLCQILINNIRCLSAIFGGKSTLAGCYIYIILVRIFACQTVNNSHGCHDPDNVLRCIRCKGAGNGHWNHVPE